MSLPSSIASDIQKLSTTALVELFELDLTSLGDIKYYFHAGTNGLGNNITWQGIEYVRYPVEADGFEKSGTGTLPRPKIKVANITGAISTIAKSLQDMLGAKITRRRTFAKYLDSVNFPPPRNVFTYSGQFGTSAWTKTGTTVVSNNTTNYFGSLSATKLVETTGSALHVVTQALSTTESTSYTFSVYCKAGSSSYIWLGAQDKAASTNHKATFDLSTGAVSYAIGCTASLTSLSGGWFRASITYPTGTGVLPLAEHSIGLNNSIGVPSSYTGNTANYLYIDSAQLEAGNITEYSPNGGTIINNPQADPNAAFPDEVWFIDRKSAENPIYLEFELTSAFDTVGVMLPRRQCIQNTCTWKYRSAECGYTGGPVANLNDVVVASMNEDACGKRLSSCKMRFGSYSQLPYGGFPGVGLIR